MGKQRKKTLQELMQDRATGTQNQSVYTSEPRRISTGNESVRSQVRNLYQRQEPQSTWDKIVTKTKDIMNDTGVFLEQTKLGAKSGIISAGGQMEFMKFVNRKPLKDFAQLQDDVSFNLSNPTPEQALARQNEKLNKATLVNGVLVNKEKEINDTPIMRMFNQKQEEVNQELAKNAQNARTSLGKYFTENVAPSMGQSLVGTGLDALVPRFRCCL